MGKISNLLDSIDSFKEDEKELYLIFKQVKDFEIPIIWFYLNENSSLIRQRINEKGKEFNHVKELSYPPASLLRQYGRANLRYQSVFYCCSFPEDRNAIYPRIITLLETSSFFNRRDSKGIQRVTCSKWIVKEKLKLIALPFYNHYKRACKDILEIQQLWDNETKKTNLNIDAKELIDYMSIQISKKVHSNNDYFKIANFINYLLFINEKTKNADGILYPSVMAQGEGFNVVLKPNVVDRKVNFAGASLCYLVKNEMRSYLMIINSSRKVSSDGIIEYEPIDITNEEWIEYCSHAEGLVFIN